MILIGLGFWSLMIVMFGFVKNFVSFVVFRIGVGVGEVSVLLVVNFLFFDYFFFEWCVIVFVVYVSGIYIGLGIGIFLGGMIVDSWNVVFLNFVDVLLGLRGW